MLDSGLVRLGWPLPDIGLMLAMWTAPHTLHSIMPVHGSTSRITFLAISYLQGV